MLVDLAAISCGNPLSVHDFIHYAVGLHATQLQLEYLRQTEHE